MSMTGHKSVQSLTVYQRVQEKTKMKMAQSQTLASALNKPDDKPIQENQGTIFFVIMIVIIRPIIK